MKAVQIEFIENQRWRWVWALAVIGCLSLMSALAWRWVQLNTVAAQENQRIAALQTQFQQHNTPVQNKVDPRQASAEQAAQLLQQDLNKGFATAENLQEPGVRLRGLTLENTSGVLRLEYDLDSVVKAAAVTEALNAGYENRPWRLEGVSTTADSSIEHRAVISMPLAPVFRGVWSVQLKNL